MLGRDLDYQINKGRSVKKPTDRNNPTVDATMERGWAIIPFIRMPHFYIDHTDRFRGYKIMEGFDRFYVSVCGKAQAGTNKHRLPSDPQHVPRCRLCEQAMEKVEGIDKRPRLRLVK